MGQQLGAAGADVACRGHQLRQGNRSPFPASLPVVTNRRCGSRSTSAGGIAEESRRGHRAVTPRAMAAEDPYVRDEPTPATECGVWATVTPVHLAETG
jgi:hypothetical protein